MATSVDITFDNMPAGDGSSDAEPVSNFDRVGVVLTGFGTFTATVEHSLDGTTWFDVQAGSTADAFVDVNVPTKFLRITVSSYSAGTPAATAVGKIP